MTKHSSRTCSYFACHAGESGCPYVASQMTLQERLSQGIQGYEAGNDKLFFSVDQISAQIKTDLLEIIGEDLGYDQDNPAPIYNSTRDIAKNELRAELRAKIKKYTGETND